MLYNIASKNLPLHRRNLHIAEFCGNATEWLGISFYAALFYMYLLFKVVLYTATSPKPNQYGLQAEPVEESGIRAIPLLGKYCVFSYIVKMSVFNKTIKTRVILKKCDTILKNVTHDD